MSPELTAHIKIAQAICDWKTANWRTPTKELVVFMPPGLKVAFDREDDYITYRQQTRPLELPMILVRVKKIPEKIYVVVDHQMSSNDPLRVDTFNSVLGDFFETLFQTRGKPGCPKPNEK